MTREGLLRFGEIQRWAAKRDQVFLLWGLPLTWETRPPRVRHYHAGLDVTLPENWVSLCNVLDDPIFPEMFPAQYVRDSDFEFARYHTELTWEKFWWRYSGYMDGPFIRAVCRAWSCEVGDVLAPIAQRRWSDVAYLDDESLGPVFGYLLRRPQSR
jgi:hypothetical protein